MISQEADRTTRRIREDQDELAERIAQIQPNDGKTEAKPGLFFNRVSSTGEIAYAVAKPSLCVIAQGAKDILLGGDRFRYDAANYLITTMELPLAGELATASPRRPYLSLRLELDPTVVTSVMVESGRIEPSSAGAERAIGVSTLDAALRDAVLRLVRLVETPEEYPVLAPLVVREIVFRLLTGEQAGRMRHLATIGGQVHRMTRAVEKLQNHYEKPLRIESLARELHMSVSGFHQHFKSATGMSPLQFQKQLRLQEARRLMLSEGFDAAQAGNRVGYDDASHFNRDYKRYFGEPPKRDVEQLREMSRVRSSPNT